MVSGLVTSPCDQLRIFSGDARLMRIASKSAIGFPSSNGFDRNKLSSRGLYATAGGSRIYLCPVGAASCGSSGGSYPDPQRSVGGDGLGYQLFAGTVGLDQLHIQTQRLQF